MTSLFGNFTFFVGREVPLDILEFLIISFGGKVISESAIDELIEDEGESQGNDAKRSLEKIDLSAVTHQICDRPSAPNKVLGRTYIQPQWIFDSINKSELLSVAEYAPGETLPPHLSPWGDAAGYDPEAPLEDVEEAEEVDEEEGEVHTDEEEEEDEDDSEKEALKQQLELEQEAAGVKFSEQQEEPKAKPTKSKKRDQLNKKKKI